MNRNRVASLLLSLREVDLQNQSLHLSLYHGLVWQGTISPVLCSLSTFPGAFFPRVLHCTTAAACNCLLKSSMMCNLKVLCAEHLKQGSGETVPGMRCFEDHKVMLGSLLLLNHKRQHGATVMQQHATRCEAMSMLTVRKSYYVHILRQLPNTLIASSV